MAQSLFDKSPAVNHGQNGSMEYILTSMVARAKDGVVSIAPGIAKRILEEVNFPEQRAINTTRVYGHGDNIRRGDWLEGHPITLVLLPDGRMWLVDGQHRLTAIAEQASPVPATIRIVSVESEKEARHFYAGFDQKKSIRTDKQIIDAVGLSESSGLTSRMTRAVYAAAPILLNHLEPISGSVNISKNPAMFLQANRMDAVQGWAHEAKKYEKIVALARTALLQKMQSPGVLAVALYTLRHQPAKADEFWSGLAANDGLRKNDPRSALISDLLVRSLNDGNIRQKVQQPALAWNAWCEGRDLKIIKCITGAELTIWGTPLKKGHVHAA
ncbi:MAG: ParB-like protein [Polaromonas sp.]